jgi:homopolymeric O-antigen transport system permease protein
VSAIVPQAARAPNVVIQPVHGWTRLGIRDVWAYRELMFFLVWRDVKVRYKQTLLGVAWAILQPLLTMVVFTIFFGRLANVGSEGLPYPLFSFAGLLPWTLFALGISQSSNSLVTSANLIKKVYFPRLVIPASSVFAGLVDFVLAFVLLLGMMAYYRVGPSIAILWLPYLVVLAVAATLGVGIWLAALNVQYRDVRYVVPFFVQIWLFVTPVIYPSSKVVAKLAEKGLPGWLYGLNPMAGVVEGFRWALLGGVSRPLGLIVASSVVSLILLVSGMYYFKRTERVFADVV